MNKKTILVGTLIGVLAGQSLRAMEEEKTSWRDTLTSGKSLVATGAVGGGAYLAYKYKDDLKPLAEKGLKMGKEYGEKAYEYAKANPGKATAAGVLLTYVAYKLYNRKNSAQSKLEQPSVNDLCAGKDGSKYQQEALEKNPVWMVQLLGLLKDVYTDTTGTDMKSVKGYLEMASFVEVYKQANPHVLFQDAALVTKMNREQKVQLLEVCIMFTLEYIGTKVQELASTLTKDKEFVKDMLREALSSGAENIIALFNDLSSSGFGLTEQQVTLVKATNEFVEECFTFQRLFMEDHESTFNK